MQPYQIEPARCERKFNFAEALKWRESKKIEYVYELKEDGRRYLLQVKPNGATQNFLTSRGISKKTGKFVEQQDTIPFLRDFEFSRHFEGCVFDGEIVGGNCRTDVITEMKKGNIQYRVWDLIYFRGQDLRQKPYWYRRGLLRNYWDEMPPWMTIVQKWLNPQELMQLVIEEKKEGIVRKLNEGIYGEGWDKVKKEDTWDVVIMGYEPSKSKDFQSKGWIGALIFGMYTEEGKLVKVGRTSGMTQLMRDKFSKNQKEYLGRVIEVKAQEQLKSGALAHPRFKRLRDVAEKAAKECIWLR